MAGSPGDVRLRELEAGVRFKGEGRGGQDQGLERADRVPLRLVSSLRTHGPVLNLFSESWPTKPMATGAEAHLAKETARY